MKINLKRKFIRQIIFFLELSGGSASVHRDNDISGVNDLLPSRKSSSSTDSCLSGNSRSGSESAGVCTGVKLFSCITML